MVAKYMGLKASDEMTRRKLAQSVGISVANALDEQGKLKSFQTLERIAKATARLTEQK